MARYTGPITKKSRRLKVDLVGGDKGRVLWRFGHSLSKSEQHDEATKVLNEAAELMPDDPAPLRSLKDLYLSQKKWDEAVRTLRRRMYRQWCMRLSHRSRLCCCRSRIPRLHRSCR